MRALSLVPASIVLGLLTSARLAQAATPYPEGQRHSPMTAEIVERLAAVVAKGGGRPDVFAKIGDSITVNPGFLGCFARPEEIALEDHAGLKATLAFFSKTTADGARLSWERQSKSAHIGWSTFGAIGTPKYSPLREEIRVVKPALAIVMMGVRDVG